MKRLSKTMYAKAAPVVPTARNASRENTKTEKYPYLNFFAKQKREATERINTPEGIQLRVNRSIQVEGAFGVIKEDYGFRRFLTRGKLKTETQFFLLAFAYNIRKLCAKIEN